jgi:hypothetical protein
VFDPAEEQFNSPASTIQLHHLIGGEIKPGGEQALDPLSGLHRFLAEMSQHRSPSVVWTADLDPLVC